VAALGFGKRVAIGEKVHPRSDFDGGGGVFFAGMDGGDLHVHWSGSPSEKSTHPIRSRSADQWGFADISCCMGG
jgi:hypothetical protein